MINKISKSFDDFTFHARVMPVLVLFLPILALGIYNGLLLDEIADNLILLSIIIIFLTFTSKISREKGKKFEEKMYDELSQKPTTILLRYSNDKIDSITKTRYHRALNEAVDGLMLPLTKDDETVSSDESYSSAINWLRIYANNNRDKEPRVYQELKEYNFWRNLYGTKIIAIVIYSCLCVREVILMENFNLKQAFLNPYPQYIALLIMLVSIIFLCFYITKSNVINKAFDYAKALIEVSERIPQHETKHLIK